MLISVDSHLDCQWSFWPSQRPQLSYQKSTLAKTFTEKKKKSKSAKYQCHYATKKTRESNNVFGFGHHNSVKVYNKFLYMCDIKRTKLFD